ncbi:hypothetical protein AAFF_G00326840 [Aldrovandia affinis]|uniref:VWFD domain-containing protein n=1 Tax=Aldrovandia affinis TaxID=143900 RepID=A0AAD7T9E1_9TELE|nr:hypothetical protein AAFF_G00326840 [Aldrovandia affinis]
MSTNMGAVLISCDFNNSSTPFCHFRQDSEDNSDWTRHRGPTPSQGTGPDGDYPDGRCFSECDFDTMGDLCGWTMETDSSIFGWEQWTGSTDMEGTGPDDDFSKPGCTSTCIASGDPHYTTFDRRRYNFMGNCSYLMAEACNTSLSPPFSVYADNEHRFNRLSITYIKAVHVHTLGVVVSVLKGGTVQVNWTTVNLPVTPAQGVSVFKSGKHYTVAADFGVTVRYDGNHYMDIKVTSDYKNTLCGLCGDYNGNPKDDFRTPSGQLVTNANDFGHSWNFDPK